MYDGAYRSNCLELDVLKCVIPEEGDTLCERTAVLEAAMVENVGATYREFLDYSSNPTGDAEVFLKVIPEGIYTGHLQAARLATAPNEMDDTKVAMNNNGGTKVTGYGAFLGEVRPTTEINRDSASSMFTVKSNGTDPVELIIKLDSEGSMFRGLIYCTFTKIG